MAAFVFAHVKFFGSRMLPNYLTLGLLFPAATAILPLFIKVRDLGLLDTYFGVVLPQVAFSLAMSILLFRRFFKDLPTELLEAALIDGCSYIAFFRHMTLPLSRPILATVGTIAFVQQLEQLPAAAGDAQFRRPLSLAARHHGLSGRVLVRMEPDPGLHHAHHPADDPAVPAGAKAHRRRPHGGRGQGLTVQRRLLMSKVGFGVIGCGVISTAYLKAAQRFANIELRAVADMRSAAAEKQAAAFGVPAMRVDQLLKRDDIEIVVNLTVPLAHTDVSLAVLNAGKHVHSEKPLGVSVAEARKVMDLAAAKGLRVGCAPDTFLGGGHQTARKPIDDGAIGRPVAGTAFFMCPGHERWHPAPGFYYLRGGGPMLDMGPYYITDLIQLLGPIASVMGSVAKPRLERLVTSEPLNGTLIPVEVATHVAGMLEFASGAVVSIAMSFDVPKHNHAPIEIYGTEGSLLVPDPNRFGGEVAVARPGGAWQTVAAHAWQCRWRIPVDRRRRPGGRDRDRPAASRQRRAGAACAGGDGSVPDFGRRRAAREARNDRRASRHDDPRPADRTDGLTDRPREHENAQGNDRMGRLAGTRPRSLRLDHPGLAQGGRLRRADRNHDSGVRRSRHP